MRRQLPRPHMNPPEHAHIKVAFHAPNPLWITSQLRLQARRERRALATPNRIHDPVDGLQQPDAALVRGQPLSALDRWLAVRLGTAVLVRLAQPEDVRQHLRRDARLCAQARDADEGGEDAADALAWLVSRSRRCVAVWRRWWWVREQSRVVPLVDVDREVRVGLGEFGREFGVEGAVDGCPERDAAAEARRQRGVCEGAGGRRGQLRRHGGGETGVESAEAVDAAGDAVEADAFETDFAHQLGGIELLGRLFARW